MSASPRGSVTAVTRCVYSIAMRKVAVPFEPVAESVGAARRHAVRGLQSRGAPRLEEDVRTVVTELATNAVLHARTRFTVTITTNSTHLRVAVTDGSATQPRLRRHGDQDATTGRGLRIVEELSTAWGVEANSTGKTTWCDLALILDVDRQPDQEDTVRGAAPAPFDPEALLAQYNDDDLTDQASVAAARLRPRWLRRADAGCEAAAA